MAILQEYQCPCCGGAIEFSSALQKMKCPYCGTEYEMETLASYDTELKNEPVSEMTWENAAGSAWGEAEAEGLHAYACKSCGGEIVGDETTAATSCPYCGNPVVIMGRLSGSLKPDLVIPFRLENGRAKYALLPVWLLNTTWNGQKYTFAMNGQTGKLVGDLPVDQAACKKWFFGLTGAISAACFAVSWLLWLL